MGSRRAAAQFFGTAEVSYNVYLHRYLMFGQGLDGFYVTASVDGLTWDTPRPIWSVPTLIQASSLPVRSKWYNNPTYISQEQPTHTVTGQSGYLYFAQGVVKAGDPTNRNLGRIPISLNLTTQSLTDTHDFNGDGKSDILWRSTGGDVAMWFMNGATISAGAGLGNVPNVWTIQNTNVD
jgi:hypothetical protein